MRFVMVTLMMFGMIGCASAPKVSQDYAAYLDVVKSNRDARDAQIAGVAAVAQACNGDARCVEHVGSMAAIAMMAGNGGQAQALPPPPQKSGMDKFVSLVGAMAPIVGTVMNGVVQMSQSDARKEMSLAQYGFLGGVVRDATTGMATVAAGAQPNITVNGGSYIPGSNNTQVGGQLGNTYGNDTTGGDRTQNSGVLGDNNRWQSPGPYDRTCDGVGCQSVPATTEDN